MKQLRWLWAIPLLLILMIPLLSKWGVFQPLKTMSYENDGRGKQKVTFEFYKEETRAFIKPSEGIGEISGDVAVISADATTPLPDIKPISGGQYVRVHRDGPDKQVMSFDRLPQSGFFFAYDQRQPEPKSVKFIGPDGIVIYEGPMKFSTVGADVVTTAKLTDFE